MGGRTGGLVGGLAVVVGVCHYTIASSIFGDYNCEAKLIHNMNEKFC